MTVTYTLDVSSVSSINFFRLLFRWKGSIWQNVLKELIVWLMGYYFVFVIYRYALSHSQQQWFERVSANYDKSLEYIPLTFMLGFFVSIVIDRWKQIINNLGFIENVALLISVYIRGKDDEARMARRTVIRYIVLSQVLVFRNISMQVRRRFPTIDSIIKQGFLHECERRTLEEISIPYNKYWAPMQWAMNLCYKMNDRDKTPQALLVQVVTEIKVFRTCLAALVNYDWVPIPIAYPQVVFLAVRSYFVICCISRQYVISKDATSTSFVDLYFPVMTVIQFIFLVGWSKVAEQLLNPLGEDADDFECNFLIDKNLETGLSIVDECFDYHPPSESDKFENPQYMENQRKMDGTTDFVKGSAAGVEIEETSSTDTSTDIKPRTLLGKLRSRLRWLKKPRKPTPAPSFCGDPTRSRSASRASEHARSRSASRTSEVSRSRSGSYVSESGRIRSASMMSASITPNTLQIPTIVVERPSSLHLNV